MEAILGLDFLEIHKCIIDLAKKELHFTSRGTSIALCTANTDHRTVDTMPIQVSLTETVHLPPYSEMETTALTSRTATNGTWLVEDKTDKRSTVMVARAMVAPTGQSIPVRVFNPTSSAIVVHSGTHIATMESVESPHNYITVASAQPDISPFKQEMLEQMVRQSEEHLTDSQRKQLLQLLECYSDVFANSKDDFGRTNRIQHQIPTGESAPIRQPVRRVPPVKRSETRELLQGMLEKDVIQPSSSPWASPIVLVKKKDGSTRLC